MTGATPATHPALAGSALETLLVGLIDYAGLFPPAALPMEEAAQRYAAYRRGAHRHWLGQFVVPVARLAELVAAAASHQAPGDSPWRLSVLAGAEDVATIRAFIDAHRGRFAIDTIEAKAQDLDTIWRLATAFDAHFTVFVEIPVAEDPAPLVKELAARGLCAKIRTGGITTDAFPTAAQVVRFLSTCARHGVLMKATAGLHHPLRGEYPLTYDRDSARGTMYGFLNIFLAATMLYDGADEGDVERLLEERDASALTASAAGIEWRTHSISRGEIALARDVFARSFGSCSFDEPVGELGALHLLDTAR